MKHISNIKNNLRFVVIKMFILDRLLTIIKNGKWGKKEERQKINGNKQTLNHIHA